MLLSSVKIAGLASLLLTTLPTAHGLLFRRVLSHYFPSRQLDPASDYDTWSCVGPSSGIPCQSSGKNLTDAFKPEAKLVKCPSRNMGAKQTFVYSMQLQTCQEGQSALLATERAIQVLAANQCPTPLIRCTKAEVQLGC